MFDFQNIDLKKEAKTLKNSSVWERAGDLKYVADFIRRKEGEQGLKRVKKKLQELGIEVPNEKELRDLKEVHSSVVDGLMVVACHEFGWGKEDIIQLGKERMSVPNSFKFFMKYFSTPEKTLEKSTEIWKKNFSRGEITLKKFDKKNKTLILDLKDFEPHPIRCVAFLGMLGKIVEMILGCQDVNTKEVKCMFEGDDHHEFVFTWK